MVLRRSTVLILAFAMLSIAFIPVRSFADSEPNDGFASAENIGNGNQSGSLNESDYDDYYSFFVPQGAIIKISVISTSNDLTVYLYDEDENWLAEVDGTPAKTETLIYQTSAETTFTTCYLLLETDYEALSYTFNLKVFGQIDSGSGYQDAPADVSDGLVVEEGAIKGHVDGGTGVNNHKGEDFIDCYKFQSGRGRILNIGFTSDSEDYLYLTLRDSAENEVFSLQVRDNESTSDMWWTANETAIGWYYLIVEQDNAPGFYTINLDITLQNDSGSGEDAPTDHLTSNLVNAGNIQGHLEDDDGADAYMIHAGRGDVISIGFRGYSTGDYLYLDLMGADASVLVSNRSSDADYGIQFFYYTANETAVQVFYIKAWMDTAPGNYVITLGIEKQDDAGFGIDVPGTSGTGTYLDTGSYEGWIFDLDMADMYMINLTGGDILSVTLSINDGTSADWGLWDNTLYQSYTSGKAVLGTPSNNKYYQDSMLGPQTCYLKVYNGQVRYSLGIAILKQNDAGSGTDAAGTLAASVLSEDPLIITAGTYTGFLHNNVDMFDCYQINVTGGNRLNITITPNSDLGINAMLYGPELAQYSMDLLNGIGVPASLQYDFAVDGWAQFILQLNSGIGDYSFVVAITEIPGGGNTTPSGPVLVATPGAMKVTLTWTAPADDGGTPVTGYNIYRKESGSLLAATLINSVGATVLTYDDTYIMLGKTYEYYVTAENAVGEGAASNKVTATPLAAATDTDGDGIPDDFEDENGLDSGDPTDATKDMDGDGHTNLAEYMAGSKINDKKSTPLDFDGDGMPNAWEIQYEFNPNDPSNADDDPDSDGRDNLQEYKDSTNPTVFDIAIDNDDDNDVVFPWIWVGVCCGGSFLAIIVLLIIILLVVASRKKKNAAASAEE